MKSAIIFVIVTAIVAFFTITPTTAAADRNNLERRTKFIIYDNKYENYLRAPKKFPVHINIANDANNGRKRDEMRNNTEVFVSTSRDDILEDALAECLPTKKYAIIVHGWRESCNTTWAKELRENLIKHRGGCIICMDYRDYNEDYGFMLVHFKAIARILTEKLFVLRDLSFDSSLAYMFGFSFGARLITRAAIDFGPKEIGTIHLCEPAGPGFDGSKNADPKMAAIQSQCIHTASGGYGTRERTCHQNWLMGNCGESQIGQRPFPYGNHGLCPVFYVHSFDHKFVAVDKADTCRQPINERDAINLPRNQIRMGYFQNLSNMTDLNEVNLYAFTTRDPPFN